MSPSVAENNCENFCEAKVCKLVSLSHGDFAESMQPCTMLSYIHLHQGLHYPTLNFYNECALNCASSQSLSTSNHSYVLFNMKREISRPMTFRLYHYANQFVKRYSLLSTREVANQTKRSRSFSLLRIFE